MDNDKNREFDEANGRESDFSSESATRARNRTVMLTPEITGQVRARLAQELEGASEHSNNPRPENAGAHKPNANTFVPPSLGSDSFMGQFNPQQRSVLESTSDDSSAIMSRQGSPVSGQQNMKPAVTPRSSVATAYTKESPIVGFLVSFDVNTNGDVYDLRSGRLIISSEPASGGNYIVIDDQSVSPMHAILRIGSTGEVQVLDQLSEFGIHIKRFGVEDEEHISGEKSTIEHGDVIRFGNRSFHVCILALNS
jgi:FHA domain